MIIEEIKLALLVELGELANEVRCFKFWSNKEPSDKQTILEEYADGIHFITSICIRLNIDSKFEIKELKRSNDKKNITIFFNRLFDKSNKLNKKRSVIKWYKSYLELGFLLGFSLEDIKQGYLDKNKVNYKRQSDNY
jgi:dimeric dUTPase (all-alpha-NTP-PPase superfamily)